MEALGGQRLGGNTGLAFRKGLAAAERLGDTGLAERLVSFRVMVEAVIPNRDCDGKGEVKLFPPAAED